MKLFLSYWLIPATVLTISIAAVYGAVQQNYRQNANDPQIQLAQDAAANLSNGASIQEVLQDPNIQVNTLFGSYVAVFDDSGKFVVGVGPIPINHPSPPSGVFDFARTREHRFTWQPDSTTRDAVVLVHYPGNNAGFVLAGRSLREVEIRERQLVTKLCFGWLVGLAILALEAQFLSTLKK